MLVRVGTSYYNIEHVKRAVDSQVPMLDHNGLADRKSDPVPMLSVYFVGESAPCVFRGKDRLDFLSGIHHHHEGEMIENMCRVVEKTKALALGRKVVDDLKAGLDREGIEHGETEKISE